MGMLLDRSAYCLNLHSVLHLNAYMYNLNASFTFLCPATKVAGYYVIPSELLSVCLSVCPSVRPSAVEHSCPVHNFDTVRDNFTKLGTNINHDQTMCRD